MAKDVVFEISWLRPLKLIGLANLLCAIICLILCMALEDWVTSDESKDFQFYMSLWKQCQKINPIDSAATTDGQEEAEVDWTCNNSVLRGVFVSVVQVLIVVPFIAAIVAFVLGCIAYCKREWRMLYKIAAIILIIAAVAVLIAIIVFPIMFLQNLPFYSFFWFGWGYGCGWAALCFMITAAVLFLISQDKKEIYHAQKTVRI